MGLSTVFGNDTDIVHWKPNPNTRGTFDILSTCIITILLCVWSAVHLNVPRPDEFWKPIGWKVLWMLIALLAPEMVAYTAWYQRHEAKKLVLEYNEENGLKLPASALAGLCTKAKVAIGKLRPKAGLARKSTVALEDLREDGSASEDTKRQPWTLTHGFYAIMGGFVYKHPHLPPERNYLPEPASQRWTVTKQGIRYLLKTKERLRDIPDIAEVDIKAKSRANALTKSLVCIQATWFCIQCITRLAEGLPISLLELNTFGHAICALLIYILWWEKPFDVENGTPLQGETMLPVCALQWMIHNSTDVTKYVRENHGPPVRYGRDGEPNPTDEQAKRRKEFTIHEFDLVARKDLRTIGGQLRGRPPLVSNSNVEDLQPRGNHGELLKYVALKPGDMLSGTEFRTFPNAREEREDICALNLKSVGKVRAFQSLVDYPEHPEISLDSVAVVRWRLAWQAMRDDGWEENNLYLPIKSLSDRNSDFPEILVFEHDAQSRWLGVLFFLAGILYGGLHALAWQANFSTALQRILWRIAACVVMSGAPVMLISGELIGLLDRVESRSHADTKKIFIRAAEILTAAIVWGLFWPVCFFYILARAYLVVECFIALSHMPAGVYDVPNWSAYFPHIS